MVKRPWVDEMTHDMDLHPEWFVGDITHERLAKAILYASKEGLRHTDDRFEWYGSANEMAEGIIEALKDMNEN